MCKKSLCNNREVCHYIGVKLPHWFTWFCWWKVVDSSIRHGDDVLSVAEEQVALEEFGQEERWPTQTLPPLELLSQQERWPSSNCILHLSKTYIGGENREVYGVAKTFEKVMGVFFQPLIVDVRTEDEFAAGRIPGAINIPLSEVWMRNFAFPSRNLSLYSSLISYSQHRSSSRSPSLKRSSWRHLGSANPGWPTSS